MTEWIASDYSQQSSLQKAMADEVLAKLSLQGDERVLDVGCGDGKITAAVAARLPSGSALGVDPSRDMIAFASKQFGPPAHANVRFEVADARHLPYTNEFDLVLSFNALHWVPEQEAALGAIRAALAPNGRALLRFVPEGPRKCLEDVIEEVRREPSWSACFGGFQKPYAHFTPEEYRAMAEKNGFRVARLTVEDKAWDFRTREAFTAFAQATFVEWTRRLSQEKCRAFIASVLDQYQLVAADNPSERNTFKFYQMEVALTVAP
jgi:trans-aconitate methyltransferase